MLWEGSRDKNMFEDSGFLVIMGASSAECILGSPARFRFKPFFLLACMLASASHICACMQWEGHNFSAQHPRLASLANIIPIPPLSSASTQKFLLFQALISFEGFGALSVKVLHIPACAMLP